LYRAPLRIILEVVFLGISGDHMPVMSDVTRILSAIDQGDPHAAEQLLPLVYDELRKLAVLKLAREKPGQTLEATALVHEAYLRLVDVDKVPHWNSRGHRPRAFSPAAPPGLLRRSNGTSAATKPGCTPWSVRTPPPM
jgi:hypothetical protein